MLQLQGSHVLCVAALDFADMAQFLAGVPGFKARGALGAGVPGMWGPFWITQRIFWLLAGRTGAWPPAGSAT
ncbi:MAG: hypothetical protein ACRDVP_09655 [Acidimicrobiales bacterium]